MPSQEQHNRLQQLSRQHIRTVWEIAGLDRGGDGIAFGSGTGSCSGSKEAEW